MSLVVTSLSKVYGQTCALDRVSLTIEKGSFTTLLGPSGSGKSTLLMCIAGFSQPTAGRIELDGTDLTDVLPERRGLGVVFQGYMLFPTMTVAKNIAFPLRMRGLPAREIDAAVRRMLELVELEAYADRRPAELSGGQQQRVAIARALSFNPSVVLLDEPLSALDRALRESLRAELKAIHASTGATFIMVTHDQEEALSLSDRVVVLNQGRVEQAGTPAELYERPRTLFAAQFIGKTNLTEVTVDAGADGLASCRGAGGASAQVLLEPERGVPAGERLHLSVRPESFALLAPGEAAPPGWNVESGQVAEESFEGYDRLLGIDTGFGRRQVRVRASGSAGLYAGGTARTPVRIAWPPQAGHLIGVH
ncbi:MAG: ABC transporter ATP-binding protein [Lautropia sp.]